MGSPDATLVYGVDIGDGEEGHGTLTPLPGASMDDVDWIRAWLDRFDDEDRDGGADDPTFGDALIRALAVRSGWRDDLDGYGPLDSTHVKDHLGIDVVGYGDCQWATTPNILTTTDAGLRICTASGTLNAGPVEVRPAELAPAGLHEGAAQIYHALAMLGLTTTRQPCWLLVADYG